MFAPLTRLSRTARTAAAAAAVALSCTLVPAGPALAGGGFATQPVAQEGAADPVVARFQTLLDRVVYLQRSAYQVVGRPIAVDRDNLQRVLADVGSRSDAEALVIVRLMQHQEEVIRLGCVSSEPACQRLMAIAEAITGLEDRYVVRFGHAIPANDAAAVEVAHQVNADRQDLAFVLRTLQLRDSIEQWRNSAQVAEDTLG